MHKKLISYIVPCYNAERFLRQCIDSILSQTYSYFEIILVDDGSKDGTPALCDQLAGEDSRIMVIHQTNQGSSAARNNGLLKATGEYIIFLDSDDFWCDVNALQKLVDNIEEPVDVLCFNCSHYFPDSDTLKPWPSFDSALSCSHSLQEAFPILVSQGITPVSPCLKVIRREWLTDHQLVFQTGILAEDIPWFIQMVAINPRVRFINEYVYAYRQNTITSVTRSNITRNYENLLGVVQTQLAFLSHGHFSLQAHDAVMSFLAYELCILLAFVRDTKDPHHTVQELRDMVGLLTYTQHPKVRLAAKICRVLGLEITSIFLNRYYHLKLRQK